MALDKHILQSKFSRQTSAVARKAFRNEVVDAMDGPLANVSENSSDGEERAKSPLTRLLHPFQQRLISCTTTMP